MNEEQISSQKLLKFIDTRKKKTYFYFGLSGMYLLFLYLSFGSDAGGILTGMAVLTTFLFGLSGFINFTINMSIIHGKPTSHLRDELLDNSNEEQRTAASNFYKLITKLFIWLGLMGSLTSIYILYLLKSNDITEGFVVVLPSFACIVIVAMTLKATLDLFWFSKN